MVSNRISSVRDADKIIVLEDGKIVELGDHKTLIKNKNYYYELFNKQEYEKEL